MTSPSHIAFTVLGFIDIVGVVGIVVSVWPT